MKVWWRICQRYNAARWRRAVRQRDLSAADRFRSRSEKFYQRVKEGRK